MRRSAALLSADAAIIEACSTYHVVRDGGGFGAAMKRGILTGIFQLSSGRKTFFVHAIVAEVGPAFVRPATGVARLLKAAEPAW
jgi:hypothetical protein